MQTMRLEGAVWTLIQQDEHVVQGLFEFAGAEHWLELRDLRSAEEGWTAGFHILACGSEPCAEQVNAAFLVKGDVRKHQRQAMKAMLAYLARQS